jgi:molecular chaperone GrpE (heat shock protein)
LVAISSAANDIKNLSDNHICAHITELVSPDEAFIKEAKERQLKCLDKLNSTKDGLIIDTANKPFVPDCKEGYEKNDSSGCTKIIKNTPPKIPLNSHVDGDGWKCNVGYLKDDSKCIKPPKNSFIDGTNWKCLPGFKKNKDSTACIVITTDTSKTSEKTAESAAIKKDKPFFDITLGIVLLALVLLFVFVVKNPRFKSKKKNTEPGQKPKNEPIPDQSDDKQTITTLRRDLSALMNSMNDLNQTFMTLKSSLDQKDKEIARYKSGYDATIYKNFLLRFTRVDKVIKEYISENKIDMNGLEDIQIQMDDALAECEVEVFSPEIGADYKTTAGLADKPKIIETSDKEKNGQIAEIIAPGYQRRMPNNDYEVIVEAKVAIHAFKK